MSENRSIASLIVLQISENLYSILLETIIMIIIASYAIYEIKQTKKDFAIKMDASYSALSDFSNSQAKKIDHLTDQVEKLNVILAGFLDVAAADVKENKEKYYEGVKTKSKKAVSSWLEKRRGTNTKESSAQE